MENLFDFLFMLLFLCRRGNNHFWCPFFTDQTRTFSSERWKDAVYDERNGEVFYSRPSRHFSLIDNTIGVLFLIFTFNWRVNNYVSRQGKGINRRNESIIIIIKICSLWYCIQFLKKSTVCFHWNFSLIIRRDQHFCYKIKNSIQSSQLTELFPQNHGNVEE